MDLGFGILGFGVEDASSAKYDDVGVVANLGQFFCKVEGLVFGTPVTEVVL